MNTAGNRTISDDGRSVLQVWIDATRPAAGRWLWGMNPVERQVRTLALQGISQVHVWLSPQTEESVRQLRPDLGRLYQVELIFFTVAGPQQIYEALKQAEKAVLLLEGDVVYDERILTHQLQTGPGNTVLGEEDTAVLYLETEQAHRLGARLAAAAKSSSGALGRLVQPHLNEMGLQVYSPRDMDYYVPALRLNMQPFILRLQEQGSLRYIDHLMYRRTFKGAIDAVARYGYYHLVRWITRQFCKTTLSPNWLTILSILSIWATVPCFAFGYLKTGVLVAWFGVILDSVDGKLARLSLHLSEAMGNIEHLAAAPGLGMWYVALGWHFSSGHLFSETPLALTTWLLVGAFLADKIASGGFKALYEKELFDYRPVDAAFHLFACRRNISLLILSAGVAGNSEAQAFALVALWMVSTLLFHLIRFAWIAVAEVRARRGS